VRIILLIVYLSDLFWLELVRVSGMTRQS